MKKPIPTNKKTCKEDFDNDYNDEGNCSNDSIIVTQTNEHCNKDDARITTKTNMNLVNKEGDIEKDFQTALAE